jgi:hypothetical protein
MVINNIDKSRWDTIMLQHSFNFVALIVGIVFVKLQILDHEWVFKESLDNLIQSGSYSFSLFSFSI